MEFKFDPDKSTTNQQKHGVDLVQGQELWRDPLRVEVPARITDKHDGWWWA